MLNTEEKLNRGSEWHRWDLQVQTRIDANYTCIGNSTLTEADMDKLTTATDLTKTEITSQEKEISPEKYAKLLIKYVELFTDITGVAVTNHNSGKELDALIAEAKLSDREIIIIPGVEISSNHGIHMLCIFDPEKRWRDSWEESIEHFLTEIGVSDNRFTTQGHPVNATSTSQEILEKTKKKGGLCIFAHIGTENGLFYHTSTANGGTAHIDIYKHPLCRVVQIPHSGNIGNGIKNIISGKDPQYGDKVVAQIKCSDSRKLSDIGNQFSWIKTDLSFDGLTQIAFEPLERVKVQDEKPDSKKPYFLIDKIRFIDNTEKNNFSGEYIGINQNLNTVIGGKSTGKSLLLYYIAKTIDSDEATKADEIKDEKFGPRYSFHDENDFDFEVVWKDGESTTLKREVDNSEGTRKIIYIPQHYLNQLSEKEMKSKQPLNAFIKNIILEDPNARQFQEQKSDEISTLKKNVTKELGNLFSTKETIQELKEDIKTLGDEKGVKKYIDDLNRQIDSVKKQSGLNEEQIKQYEEINQKIKDIEDSNTNLERDKKALSNFTEQLKTQLDTDDLFEEHIEYFNEKSIKEKISHGFGFIKTIPLKIDEESKKVSALINSKIKENNEVLTSLKSDLAPLLSIIKMQAELESKRELIKKENEKLNRIKNKKRELETKNKIFNNKKDSIIDTYDDLFSKYEDLQSEYSKYSDKLRDINLKIVIGFNNEAFNKDVVSQFLNKSDLKKIPDSDTNWNEEFEYVYDSQKHPKFIKVVFNRIIEGEVKTIRGRDIKDALSKLLNDNFYIDFKVSYKTDSLDKMSPGKKGLVLLKIIVSLSDEEWPIILDQPEDDLDNRSVYTDLANFIKEKKKYRQILIATHNPNLVVGADAEEVIVANQSGQDVDREKARFHFEYIAGALENSFIDKDAHGVLYQMGIRQHVYDVLEGGKEAFQKREMKYDIQK